MTMASAAICQSKKDTASSVLSEPDWNGLEEGSKMLEMGHSKAAPLKGTTGRVV
jgi:hypothetical protein